MPALATMASGRYQLGQFHRGELPDPLRLTGHFHPNHVTTTGADDEQVDLIDRPRVSSRIWALVSRLTAGSGGQAATKLKTLVLMESRILAPFEDPAFPSPHPAGAGLFGASCTAPMAPNGPVDRVDRTDLSLPPASA